MNAPRRSRTRRVALATAGLGLAALTFAPAASADLQAAYPPAHHHHGSSTQVLGVKFSSDEHAGHTAAARVSATDTHAGHSTASEAESLAFTGVQVGGLAAAGLGLTIGGLALVRMSSRRPELAA